MNKNHYYTEETMHVYALYTHIHTLIISGLYVMVLYLWTLIRSWSEWMHNDRFDVVCFGWVFFLAFKWKKKLINTWIGWLTWRPPTANLWMYLLYCFFMGYVHTMSSKSYFRKLLIYKFICVEQQYFWPSCWDFI